MYFQIYQNGDYAAANETADEWHWRLLKSGNAEVITSGETYKDKQDCLNAIEVIKSTSKHTVVQETTKKVVSLSALFCKTYIERQQQRAVQLWDVSQIFPKYPKLAPLVSISSASAQADEDYPYCA